MIFSGQERSTGCNNYVRKAMLKKMLTSEGIAGHLPYAMLTRMVKRIGWKRVELDKLFRVDDIDDTHFEIIGRRCAVIRILAKLCGPSYQRRNYTALNHEQYGICAREADAGVCLTCPPGVLAGRSIQHAFAEDHQEQDSRAIMEGYTSCGDDNGVTVRDLHMVCGLPVDTAVLSVHPMEAMLYSSKLAEESTRVQDVWPVVQKCYTLERLHAKTEFLTESSFQVFTIA